MLDAEKRGDKRRSLRGKDPSRDEGSKSFQPESGPKGSVLGRTNSRGAPMAGTARDAINFESEVEYLRAEEVGTSGRTSVRTRASDSTIRLRDERPGTAVVDPASAIIRISYDDEYATGSIIDHSDIEPTVPVFKTNPHYIAQYAIADSLPGLPPAPATQDDYPEVGTWSQSHSFILNKVATESLFQEKGWLSSDVVDASCCLTINEWLEGADVEDNLSKLLFVPSNAWQLFTSPTSSPLSFAHSPRPLQSRYIVIPVNDANHWFLILIFDAVEALHPNTGTPTAVVLDSLPAQGAALDDRMKRYSTLIKRFLVALARSSKSPAPHRKRFEVNLIPFKSGLPLQTNTHDCGLYPAYYLRSFLKRPDDMEVGFKHPKPQIPPEWWYPQYHWHLRRGLQQRVSLLFQEIGRA